MKGEMASAVKLQFIDTLDDLINSPYYLPENVGVSIEEYELYQRFLKNPDHISFLSKLKAIRSGLKGEVSKNGLTVVFFPASKTNHYMPDCDHVYPGKEEYLKRTLHAFFSTNLSLPLQKTIRYLTSTFAETGQERLHRIYANYNGYSLVKNIPLKPIKMSFLKPIFVVWFCGVALSVVAIALEMALPTKKEEARRHPRN